MTAKELREKRAGLAAEIKRLADLLKSGTAESRDFTNEERPVWDRVNKEYDDLSRQIEIAERAEKIAADQSAAAGNAEIGRGAVDNGDGDRSHGTNGHPRAVSEEARALALQAWLRAPTSLDLTERHVAACQESGLNPNRRQLDFALPDTTGLRIAQRAFRTNHLSVAPDRATQAMLERRDLSASLGTAGGFVVPDSFVRSLEVAMLAYGGMLQVAEIIRTQDGGDLAWPTSTDTTNTGVQLSESTTIGSSVDPTFAELVLGAYKFSSKLIKVPVELLEDSAFDLASLIGAMLGERLGRISNTKFTTGTGAATPRGITVSSTLGVTSASATAISADEVVKLVHSVDPAYRVGAQFMLHDSVLLHLRMLKDGEGRFLWQTDMRSGAPDSLYGYPMTINQDMASSVAASAKTLLFGQLNRYKIRQVGSMRFRRLDERYADYDQVGFIAFLRQDGGLLDAGTHPVKHLLQTT